MENLIRKPGVFGLIPMSALLDRGLSFTEKIVLAFVYASLDLYGQCDESKV
jgi:hypothetical protein